MSVQFTNPAPENQSITAKQVATFHSAIQGITSNNNLARMHLTFRARIDHYQPDLTRFFLLLDALILAGIPIDHLHNTIDQPLTKQAGISSIGIHLGQILDIATVLNYPMPEKSYLLQALQTLSYPKISKQTHQSRLWQTDQGKTEVKCTVLDYTVRPSLVPHISKPHRKKLKKAASTIQDTIDTLETISSLANSSEANFIRIHAASFAGCITQIITNLNGVADNIVDIAVDA